MLLQESPQLLRNAIARVQLARKLCKDEDDTPLAATSFKQMFAAVQGLKVIPAFLLARPKAHKCLKTVSLTPECPKLIS